MPRFLPPEPTIGGKGGDNAVGVVMVPPTANDAPYEVALVMTGDGDGAKEANGVEDVAGPVTGP